MAAFLFSQGSENGLEYMDDLRRRNFHINGISEYLAYCYV